MDATEFTMSQTRSPALAGGSSTVWDILSKVPINRFVELIREYLRRRKSARARERAFRSLGKNLVESCWFLCARRLEELKSRGKPIASYRELVRSVQMRPRAIRNCGAKEYRDLRNRYREDCCIWQLDADRRDGQTVVCYSGCSVCEYSMVRLCSLAVYS